MTKNNVIHCDTATIFKNNLIEICAYAVLYYSIDYFYFISTLAVDEE